MAILVKLSGSVSYRLAGLTQSAFADLVNEADQSDRAVVPVTWEAAPLGEGGVDKDILIGIRQIVSVEEVA